MVMTHSGLENDNKSCWPEPQAIEHAPKAISVVERVIMEMLRTMFAEQKEEMRQLIRENRREPTVPVEQLELNEG